jgi:hypothetical protein
LLRPAFPIKDMEQATANSMRRYFFHIRHNGETVMDEEGDEFESVDEARTSAIHSVRELVASSFKKGHRIADKYMDVHDDMGDLVASISFHGVIEDQLGD